MPESALARFARKALAPTAMAIAFGLPARVEPQVTPPKADMWEVTTKVETADGWTSLQTNMVCLAKETKDENYIPRRDECRTTKTERLASTLNFHMVCEGKDPMTIAGVLSIGQKTFGIRMTLTGEKDGRETEVIQMVVGMRIGECPLMLRATPP